MKQITILLLFLTFQGVLFGQQSTDSCTVKAPTKLEKQGCGDQRVHVQFDSPCPIEKLEITFYNRWGNILHVSYELDYFLPGKMMESGTYYFHLKGTFLNGGAIDQNGYFNLL